MAPTLDRGKLIVVLWHANEIFSEAARIRMPRSKPAGSIRPVPSSHLALRGRLARFLEASGTLQEAGVLLGLCAGAPIEVHFRNHGARLRIS